MFNPHVPPKCVITFHAYLPLRSAQRLADLKPNSEDGSFFIYFQIKRINGKRDKNVNVYRYTPIKRF